MKPEFKVGILFVVALVMVVVFAYVLGVTGPLGAQNELVITYNFAGGIEVGSPVRVMGIKVGKVKSIDFDPEFKMPNGEEVKLKIKVYIDKKAWTSIRTDSHFYINLAGVIGEKFLEITPGTENGKVIQSGDVIRGEDPPRIDQLISQSYSLAGKVIEMIEKNEGSVVNTIETINRLVVNLDKALRQLDKTAQNREIGAMLRDMQVVLSNSAALTSQLRSNEAQETMALLNTLIKRLEPLDSKAIKQFLQQEGIKAKMF